MNHRATLNTPMDRPTYDRYLAHFNARDYAGVLRFYADDFEIVFAGYCLRGREQMLRFYGFLHEHLKESISVDRVVGDAHTLAAECRVRIEGRRDLSVEALSDAGYGRLFPLQAGQVIEIPQFIHYHLDDQGRFTKALCAVFEAPRA